MNRNSLILMYRGKQRERSTEYNEQRMKLKNIQCALASFELSSKAWHSATLDMGRNMDLLCDAIRAIHSADSISAGANIASSTAIDVSMDKSTAQPADSNLATPQECPLYEDQSSTNLCELFSEFKRDASNAFHTFAVSMQQQVTSPLFSLIHEFQECEAVRHQRNRAQEKFEVDDSALTQKMEDYQKKGRKLSESKKYTDMVVQRNASHEALEHADAQYQAAYTRLVDQSFAQMRLSVTQAVADNGASLFGMLRDRLAAISAAATQTQHLSTIRVATDVVKEVVHKGRAVAETVQHRVQQEAEGLSTHAVQAAARFAAVTSSLRSGSSAPQASSDEQTTWTPTAPPADDANAETSPRALIQSSNGSQTADAVPCGGPEPTEEVAEH